MSKVRVAVLRGGISDEYPISLKTGASVLEHIDKNRFQPLDIVISRTGEWLFEGKERLPEHLLHCVDVVFNGLHGAYGEDGTVQRLLDRYGVPYTGSRAFASGIAMNKIATKQALKESGIRMPEHVHVTKDSLYDIGRVVDRIADTCGSEYVIKPVSSGSSLGTMVVKNKTMLRQALQDSLGRFDEVMVESRIEGREATCGVVERYRDTAYYALPPIEIVLPKHADFFDHSVKYNGKTQEFCPSSFSVKVKTSLEDAARLVHQSIGLSQYSRSDFIVAPDGIFFLEVNTLPGLTKESLLPKAITAVGGTYTDFITHLLTDAQKQFSRY